MGAKLKKAYDFAEANGGLLACMRLAMLTLMPLPKALAAPDSPENLAKFRKGVKEATGKDCPDLH